MEQTYILLLLFLWGHVELTLTQQDVHAALRDVTAKLGQLQTKMEELQTLSQGQAAEIKSLKTWISEAGNHVDSLMADRAVGRVAFSASLLASGSGFIGPFDTSKPLEYKHVTLNIGSAYNSETGVFTAPARGVYHFSFHFATGLGSHSSILGLVKNGSIFCSAMEKPSGDQFGTTGNEDTVLLEAGDLVFVVLTNGFKVYDDQTVRFSTFSGRLLFPV